MHVKALYRAGLFGVLALAGSCADDTPRGSTDSAAGARDRFSNAEPTGSTAGPAGSAPVLSDCHPQCQDFPAEPILDDGGPSPVPADAAARFGTADRFGDGGPCVLEPALSDGELPGALLPPNWLRPRFRFEPLAGETLWEIRLRAESEAHDLVAYTTATVWTLPREVWRGMGVNLRDAEITVTVRGLGKDGGTPSGTRGSFSIAPVEARGKLVYWGTRSSEVAPDTSQLTGFAVGDEGVATALTVPQVGDRGVTNEDGRGLRAGYGAEPGHVQCIGCHVSTPDGEAVAFLDHWPWNLVVASVQPGRAGQRPAYLTQGAELLLSQPWQGMPSFSPAHWSEARRILVAAYSPRGAEDGVGFGGPMYPSSADGLAWFDLATDARFEADPAMGDVQAQLNDRIRQVQGEAWGLLELGGETRSAASPDFSHDGRRIVYAAADFTRDGRLAENNAEVDLHVVPFANGAGGEVKPLPGAAEPGVAEYYPAFSADDRLVAFTRVDPIDANALYYRPDGEIHVVPAEGGRATRLIANDPPACSGERSPGVINSWPKWAPSVPRVAASAAEFGKPPRSFYFLIFSSARAYPGQFELPRTQYSPPDTRSSQLYMAAIVRDDDSGELTTHPATYLWNQDPSTSNLTPAWDEFDIPAVTPPD
jgi:hypothetical protein